MKKDKFNISVFFYMLENTIYMTFYIVLKKKNQLTIILCYYTN